tara:strand:- start:467 stop:1153 length:687 start_codon:yes stop_codon:yes gene_type:complete
MPKDYKKFLEGQTLSYLLAEPNNDQLNEQEDGTKDLYEIIEKATEIKGDELANNQLKVKKTTKNSKIVKRISDSMGSKGVGSSKNTPAYHAEQAQLFSMSALTCIEKNNSSKATWNAIRAQNAIVTARNLLAEIYKENRFESDHFAKNISIIGKTKSETKSELIELIDEYEELLIDHDRYGAFRRLAAKRWGRPAIKITIQEVNEITKLVHEAYALNPERVDRSKSQD